MMGRLFIAGNVQPSEIKKMDHVELFFWNDFVDRADERTDEINEKMRAEQALGIT